MRLVILDSERKEILLKEENSHDWTIKSKISKAFPKWINFYVDLILQTATSIDFTQIGFREQPI